MKVVNRSAHELPAYSTLLSAGMDLRANLQKEVNLLPMQRVQVGTGIFIELPEGYEAQIRPRSGLALDRGLIVLNIPGTIDADYRGEIKIILINLSDKEIVLIDGERICQMIISKHEKVSWEEVEILTKSERGAGGFGHTGKL